MLIASFEVLSISEAVLLYFTYTFILLNANQIKCLYIVSIVSQTDSVGG